MPFVQVDINKEIENKLIGEMISLRKAEKITQSQLAAITGSKQQVISRIEKKQNI